MVDFDQWTICSKIIVKTHTMPIGFYFERSTSTHRPPQTSSKTSSNGEVFLTPLSMDSFETFSHVRLMPNRWDKQLPFCCIPDPENLDSNTPTSRRFLNVKDGAHRRALTDTTDAKSECQQNPRPHRSAAFAGSRDGSRDHQLQGQPVDQIERKRAKDVRGVASFLYSFCRVPGRRSGCELRDHARSESYREKYSSLHSNA